MPAERDVGCFAIDAMDVDDKIFLGGAVFTNSMGGVTVVGGRVNIRLVPLLIEDPIFLRVENDDELEVERTDWESGSTSDRRDERRFLGPSTVTDEKPSKAEAEESGFLDNVSDMVIAREELFLVRNFVGGSTDEPMVAALGGSFAESGFLPNENALRSF